MYRTNNDSDIAWEPKSDATKQLMENIINQLVSSSRVYDSESGCVYDVFRIPMKVRQRRTTKKNNAGQKRSGRKQIFEKENHYGHSAKSRYDLAPVHRRNYNQAFIEEQELLIIKKNCFLDTSSPEICNPIILRQSPPPLKRLTDVDNLSIVDDSKGSTIRDDYKSQEDEELLDELIEEIMREYSSNLGDSATVLSDDYIKMPLPRRGFPNHAQSNSCWMNASLQNILRMRFFVADVLKCNSIHEDHILLSFTNVVKNFVHGSVQSLVICLRLFKNSLKQWNSEFHCPRQQDASEFFSRFLLHVLDFCDSGEGNNHLKESIKEDIELTVRRRIVCPSCQSVLKRDDESSTVFHLMVDSEEKKSVQKHFDKEMAPKTAEMFICPQCDCPALQVSSIIKLPIYMILELNRPLSSHSMNEIERKEVQLTEELNLGRWTSEQTSHLPSLAHEDDLAPDLVSINENLPKGTDDTYQLTGVISHMGKTPTAGHYVADVYEPADKKWYHIDDLEIEQTSLGDDVGGSYLLVYSKMSKCIMD